MSLPQELAQLYVQILDQQEFQPETLDYSILEIHKPMLKTLASVGNTGVSVFDMYRRQHVFYSPNFCNLLGYDVGLIEQHGHDYLDAQIHPEDLRTLTQNGISILKLYYEFSAEEKANYKLINEFRIKNAEGKYRRVVEQHQVLALDARGNVWLSLSIIDLSPNQQLHEPLKSQLLNFKTGQIIPFEEDNDTNHNITLTPREKEVLALVRDGFLSKEISDKLFISLHTVNTHRQRVLEKLGANNSIEAVRFASRLGLF